MPSYIIYPINYNYQRHSPPAPPFIHIIIQNQFQKKQNSTIVVPKEYPRVNKQPRNIAITRSQPNNNFSLEWTQHSTVRQKKKLHPPRAELLFDHAKKERKVSRNSAPRRGTKRRGKKGASANSNLPQLPHLFSLCASYPIFLVSFPIPPLSAPPWPPPTKEHQQQHTVPETSVSSFSLCFRSANFGRRRTERTRSSGNYWEAISPTSRASTAPCLGGGSARTVRDRDYFGLAFCSPPFSLPFLLRDSFLVISTRARVCITRNSRGILLFFCLSLFPGVIR